MAAEFMDRHQRKALGSCRQLCCRGIEPSTFDNTRKAATVRNYIDANHMVVAHKRPKGAPPIWLGGSRPPSVRMLPPLPQSALRKAIHRCLSQMGSQPA